MATVTAVNSSGKGGGGLRGSLRYISQDKKALLEDGRRLVSGVNCCPDTAYTEFMTTKRSFDKTGGRQFYHFVQSFHPDENVTPERVHQIGLELAQRRFPGYEIVVATHTDAEHLHSHMIVNSVSFETGKKLHQSLDDLRRHRIVSDEICQAHGLTVLPPEPTRSPAKGVQHREYRAAVRGDSWKFKLINAIDHSMSRSRTRREFLENMRRMGYQANWSDSRKSITYTTPEGQKCRDYRLPEPKYLKENMYYEFELRSAKGEELARALQAGETVSTGGLRDTGGTVGGVHRTDERQSDAAAHHSERASSQRSGENTQREYTANSVIAGGAVETGWEASRRELETLERSGAEPHEAARQLDERTPDHAINGLSVAADLAGLARNLCEMSGEPELPVKPKTVHERKRGIGQKQDDHEQAQEYELSM